MKSRDIAPNSIPRAIEDRAAALVVIGDVAMPPVAPGIFPTPSADGALKDHKNQAHGPDGGSKPTRAVPVAVLQAEGERFSTCGEIPGLLDASPEHTRLQDGSDSTYKIGI